MELLENSLDAHNSGQRYSLQESESREEGGREGGREGRREGEREGGETGSEGEKGVGTRNEKKEGGKGWRGSLSHTKDTDVEVFQLLSQLRIYLLSGGEINCNHHHLHTVLTP